MWFVPRPGRHHDVIRKIAETLPPDGFVSGEQGFVTSHRRFVSRREGDGSPWPQGQTEALKWGDRLFSEDLW